MALPAINPAIVGQLDQIKNIEKMKTRFAPIPANDAFTKETQFSKVYSLGAFALGLIAGFVYTKNYLYPAIVLGVAALGLALAKGRVTVEVPTEATTTQRTVIDALFEGAASELRTAWTVVSDNLSKANNERKASTVDAANEFTADRLEHIASVELTDDERPWINQFVALKPDAEIIAGLDLKDADKAALSSYFLNKFHAVQTECSRLVTGKAEEPVKAYVENTKGAEADAVVVSKPWSAPALKV